MKKILIIAVSLPLMWLAPKEAEAQNVTSAGIHFCKIDKQQSGRELVVSYKICPEKKAIPSQSVIVVYPRIVSRDGKHSVDLKSFAVAGPRRYRLIRRSLALHNQLRIPHTDTIVSSRQEPELVAKVPFSRWMADAHMELDEKVYKCGTCPDEPMMSTLPLPETYLFSPKHYRYDFVEPQEVNTKRFEEKFESKVTFAVAKTDLRPNFANNTYELHRLQDFMTRSLSHEGTTLDTVKVTGYASPEGRYDFNIYLSDTRARVLADYAGQKYPILNKVHMTVKGMGEDWQGLEESLNKAEVSYAPEVIEVIRQYQNPDRRKSAIKNLKDGEIYRNMLTAFYPQLRKTVFSMGYRVRFFNDSELESVFAKDPRLMSNNELYRLAQQYEKQGMDPTPVYEEAYKLYPNDVVAALNYANALLKYCKGEYEHALNILAPFESDPRTVMPRAIAENELGHYDIVDSLIHE